MANRILTDPDRELPHVTNESGWLVPAVKPELSSVAPNGTTREDWFRWPEADRMQLVNAPKGLVYGFAALAGKPERAIRAFAARFGPLRTCVHRPLRAEYAAFRTGFVEYGEAGSLLAAHPDGPLYFRDRDPAMRWCECRDRPGICHNGYAGDGNLWEPVALWQVLAEQARAIVQCAVNVAMGQPGDAADWTVIRGMLGIDRGPALAAFDPAVLRSVAEAAARTHGAALGDAGAWRELVRTFLAAPEAWRYRPDDPLSRVAAQATLCLAVECWLDRGGVRPRLVLPLADGDRAPANPPRALPGQPAVRFGATSLVGALALQLALALADVPAAPTCTICNQPYEAKRRPRTDTAPTCGRKECVRARDRLAKQRQRDRQRLRRMS